jgi:tetraacyldisaccharide 4'-kinase
MRAAPAFWARPPGVLADLLLPAGAAWDAAGRVRRALSRPYRPSIPVLCVGNLVVGGAGKTPVAAALASDLAVRGVAVHLVTRGYGGRLRGPVRVDPAYHDAAQIGDEALLLAVHAPCWVARDRSAGVRAAITAGARAIVLDDGLQNPAVAKTLSFVVVDADYGFGNRRVIPAGPLRENLGRGLARADAVVLLASEAPTKGPPPSRIGEGLPVFRAVLSPVDGQRLAGSRLLAFAGIGRPKKFFATLCALGAELIGTRPFPDHHRFRIREIEQLLREAERVHARLITTAKDIVRIPPGTRTGIEVLEVEVRWHDPDAIAGLIKRVLSNQCPYRLA